MSGTPEGDGEGDVTPSQAFDRHMLEVLVCPRSQGRLDYDAARQELVSKPGGLAFPIRNGIPVLLIDEARELD